MPDFPRKYRILGATEQNILFQITNSQDFPTKNVDVSAALDVSLVSFISVGTIKFPSSTVKLSTPAANSHAAQNLSPTISISVVQT